MATAADTSKLDARSVCEDLSKISDAADSYKDLIRYLDTLSPDSPAVVLVNARARIDDALYGIAQKESKATVSPEDASSSAEGDEKVINTEETVIDGEDIGLIATSLRVRLNALAPISCLPPDILIKVFTTYATDDPEFGGYHLSGICHEWREIALGYASLWTSISDRNVKWWPVLLQRSNTAGLDVTIDGKGVTEPSIYAPILEHLPRIRHLDLKMEARVFLSLLPYLSNKSAPTLETIKILRLPIDAQSTLVLPNLFGSDAPRLCKVELRGIALGTMKRPPENPISGWGSPILTDLAHLELENIAYNVRPTIEELLHILQRSSRLKTLILHGACPTPGIPGQTLPSVSLPHLSMMSLSDDLSNIAVVSKRLSIPPTAIQNYYVPESNVNEQNGATALELFQGFLPTSGVQPHRLFLGANDPRHDTHNSVMQVKFWTPSSPNPQISVNIIGAHFEMAYELDWLGAIVDPLAVTLCRLCDMTHLRIMDCFFHELLSESFWPDTFHDCYTIQTVSLVEEAAYGFLSKMLSEKSEGVILLPALRRLQFRSINFQEDFGLKIRQLCQLVQTRKERGMALEKVSFVACDGVPDSMMYKLHEHVGEVILNGKKYAPASREGERQENVADIGRVIEGFYDGPREDEDFIRMMKMLTSGS